MSKKRFVLFISSVCLLLVSLVVLITAMVLHAVFGDGSLAVSVVAVISLALSFVSIVVICLFGKGEKQ